MNQLIFELERKTMNLSRRALLQTSAAAPAAKQASRGSSRLPNFVFLISDDHSWPDLGCYGNSALRTPNLDRLASEGMRFDNCFVASPQCSPNRSAILTGCTPHTTSTSRLHTPMPPWEPTFLEPLKQIGYFTGAFRKVHQGSAFDRRWDFYAPKSEPFEQFFDALAPDRPFFLHVGFHEPHRPYHPGTFSPPHDPAAVRRPAFLPDTPAVRQDLAHYADAIAHMDAECGQIFDLLRRRSLAENTLVVFTGDNGMPFPRAKGSLYDPGLRVPLLARWPGRIPAGSICKFLISHVDLAPTWLEAAGLPKPDKMQGRSFLPLLLGRTFEPRQAVFSERNWHNHFDPQRSVRTSRYKLIFNAAPHFPYRPASDLEASPTWQEMVRLARQGKLSPPLMRMFDPARPLLELYDLESDPDEFHNLATSPQHATVLADLSRLLSDWMHDTYDFLPPALSSPGQSTGRGWPATL
jgi:arylsulfatase A-like enzyme